MKKNLPYRKAVFDLAENKYDFEIPNSSINHAKDIIDAIFEYSTKSIDIFCGDLKNEVYGSIDFLLRVSSFLSRNKDSKLRVLVQNLTSEEIRRTNLFHFLEGKQNISERVSFFSGSASQNITAHNSHFQIGDNRIYRKEGDTSNIKAVANFNDSLKAGKLLNIFNGLLEEAQEVSN